MISPSEIKERMKVSSFESEMQDALKIVDKEIKEALANRDIKTPVPTVRLGNKYRTEALAQRLIQLGYTCKKESISVGGVRQNPRWFIYFI